MVILSMCIHLKKILKNFPPLHRLERTVRLFCNNLRSFFRIYRDMDVVLFLYDHYQRLGYNRSVLQKEPIDAAGEAIPWFTYPAIEYLSQIDFSQKRVFEYGAGYSTVFWGKKAAEVISVDNNQEWVEKVKKMVASNVIHAVKQEAYVSSITPHGLFDVIVIDGRFRNACTQYAIKALRDGGMIIVDNSEWCPLITQMLRSEGFTQCDLHGIVPGLMHCSTTSFFFKGSFSFTGTGTRFPEWPLDGLRDTYGLNE